MNIVYTLNDKFVPQVAAGICSICENNKNLKKIFFYLISHGITKINKQKLKKIVEKYGRDIEIIELGNINDYFDFEFNTFGWNSIVLARLVIDKILPKSIDRILYLDGDTIVRGSLLELCNLDMKNKTFGMSIEPTVDKKRKHNLGLDGYAYYNAGVILINLERWRKIEAGKKIINYYKKSDGKLFANDQDAINGSLKDEIFTLSCKYNFYNIFYQYSYRFLCRLMNPVEYLSKDIFEEAVRDPIIIHYLGEERPWRKGNNHKYKKDYLKYLNMTPWYNQNLEDGWKFYFICWNIFNFVMKLFPMLRYNIINKLIPVFMKYRANKLKK